MKNETVLSENSYPEFMLLLDVKYKFQLRNHDHISETMDKKDWIEIYGGYTVQEVIDSINEESKC